MCLLAQSVPNTEMTCMHKLKCVGHCVLALNWLCGAFVVLGLTNVRSHSLF